MKKNRLFITLFVVPSLILYAVFFLYPNLSSLLIALYRWNIANLSDIKFAGFANFIRLWDDRANISKCMINNMYFAVFGIFFSLSIALLLSALVTGGRKRKLPESNFYRSVFYFPNLISGVATAMMWTLIYSPIYGLTTPLFKALGLQSLASIPLLGDETTVKPALLVYQVWGSIGFSFVIFLAAISRIPDYLYEASAVDGAGKIRQFFSITLPLIGNTIKTLLIISIAGAFAGGFVTIQVMTDGGPNMASEILPSYMYKMSFLRANFGYGAAIGTMIFFLTLGMYFVANKLFSKGDGYEY